MKIEILYPQLCCLYGDKGNTLFLQKCLPQAEFVFTQLNDKPRFLTEDVDLCCMYSMSEQSQELVLSRMGQWKEEIHRSVESGKTFFLLLGNSMELFGQYIQREDGSKVEALGVLPTYAVRQAPRRFNTLLQTQFRDMTLLGYTSRFSHTYGISEDLAFSRVTVGTGSEPNSKLEGIYRNRLIGTYLLGPLLVANPDFSKWLLTQLGLKSPALPFEDALYQSYQVRLAEFQNPQLVLE